MSQETLSDEALMQLLRKPGTQVRFTQQPGYVGTTPPQPSALVPSPFVKKPPEKPKL